MDKLQEATNFIRDLNQYQKGQVEDFEFIQSVCRYFDKIKNEELNSADYKFLKYISAVSGVPHFYDMLTKFNQSPYIDSVCLNTFASFFYESTLHTDKYSKMHKYQKMILEKFDKDKKNKFFLSASTSFGKTHLVFDLIKKMDYSNIVLIFPTIALLSENLEKILSNDEYKLFKKKYKIHTMSEVVKFAENNIFIYTPERYLSFMEKTNIEINFDFVFVDEVYKIDNDYIMDDVAKENERDVAYRLAVFHSLKINCDILLAGPYIDFSKRDSLSYNSSFDNFLDDNNISLLDFNNYELVDKTFINKSNVLKGAQWKECLGQRNKSDRLFSVARYILDLSENLIVYCSLRAGNGGVEGYAKALINTNLISGHDVSGYSEFINHVEDRFGKDWILVKALKRGIGIHHGLIPKYIQKEIINLFNEGFLKILISTTTITEGVNTSAKNLVVMHSKKGDKPLRKFDAKNIAGRAGRFGFHYSGNVIDISDGFMKVIESQPDPIKHKNYDLDAPKDDIDLFCTNDDYLSKKDIRIKEDINTQQKLRNIPDSVMDQYKVISRNDKIKIYDSIRALSNDDFQEIERLISQVNRYTSISYEGFQVVLIVIRPIVTNKALQNLIDTRKENQKKKREFSVLSSLVFAYLGGSFLGSVKFKKARGESTDAAIRDTAKFIYNTLKYQVVKYLGVFNLIYKFYISQRDSINIKDVSGFEKLLLKFECNALTDEGRIANDYGVPFGVVDYYEKTDEQFHIKANFDSYELKSLEQVAKIIIQENKE